MPYRQAHSSNTSRPGQWRRAIAAGATAIVVIVTAAAAYLTHPGADRGRSEALTDTSPLAEAPSDSATTSAIAAPATTAPSRVAAVGGWVAVDHAAWTAQVEAYRALTVDPVPAGVGNLPEFRADCQYSHSLADDPIVLPGLPGASHMHSFVGNRAVNAGTAAQDLMTFPATTCKPIQDHSAYWVPTLYDNATGTPVETTGFRVYYRSLMNTSTGQLPMPNGLRMISGDATKKEPTPRGATGQFYCAFYGPGDLDGIARSTNGNWPICGGNATLHFMLQFPDCWDGEHLDSPNLDHPDLESDEFVPGPDHGGAAPVPRRYRAVNGKPFTTCHYRPRRLSVHVDHPGHTGGRADRAAHDRHQPGRVVDDRAGLVLAGSALITIGRIARRRRTS